MSAYIVTYDLHTPGQKYDCFMDKLDAYGTHWHMQLSAWIVDTKQSAEQIRDNLLTCLNKNDKIFVGKLAGDASWSGTTKKGDQWIKNRLAPPQPCV